MKQKKKKSQFVAYLKNKKSIEIDSNEGDTVYNNTINWYRYYDENYQSYYLVNSNTNESRWEEDFRKNDIDQYNRINVIEYTTLETNDDEDDKDDQSSIITNDNNLEDDNETYNSNDNESKSLLSIFDNNNSNSNNDFQVYKRYIIINSIIVEAPLCVVEGLLRCILIILVYLCILISNIILVCMKVITISEMINQLKINFYKYGYEFIMSFNGTIIIAIPGFIYYVYKEYSTEDDWCLYPLPTLIGFIDIRRFGTITFGGGSSAKNCDIILNNNQYHQKESDTDIIRTKDDNNSLMYNQDSWKGEIIFIPRNIIKDIIMFIRGSNRIDSFNIHL